MPVPIATWWFVAVVFTPYLGVLLLPKTTNIAAGHKQDTYSRPLHERLRRVLRLGVSHRAVVLGATAGFFALSIVGLGLVQQQFFPTASRLELVIDLRLREGASFTAIEVQVKRLEKILKADPKIASFSADTGAGAPRFFLSILRSPCFRAHAAVRAGAGALPGNQEDNTQRQRIRRAVLGPLPGIGEKRAMDGKAVRRGSGHALQGAHNDACPDLSTDLSTPAQQPLRAHYAL